jgi:hypothetical protein
MAGYVRMRRLLGASGLTTGSPSRMLIPEISTVGG